MTQELREKVARAIDNLVASGVTTADMIADAAISIIRAEVLEEAAKVADAAWNVGCTTYEVAAAIRALGK